MEKRAFKRRKNTLTILIVFSLIISMTATAVSAVAEIQYHPSENQGGYHPSGNPNGYHPNGKNTAKLQTTRKNTAKLQTTRKNTS